MDVLLVLVLYVAGLGLVIAESMMPGLIIGLIGTALLTLSLVFGYSHHWALGTAQLALAVLVAPLAFLVGIRKLALKASLEKAGSFEQDYAVYQGHEGHAHTDLRPAGIAMIDGRKLDVVTSGESVVKGCRVRVVLVEGNRVVVRAI